MDKKQILIALGILVFGVAIGRFTLPAKVVEKIVYQDKIVERRTELKDVKRKDNKIIIKFEKILPDGTRTIETKIIDKDVVDVVDNNTDTKTEDKSSTTEKTITYDKTSLLLSVQIKNNMQYGILINKRLLGPIYINGFGFLDKTFGLGVGLGF